MELIMEDIVQLELTVDDVGGERVVDNEGVMDEWVMYEGVMDEGVVDGWWWWAKKWTGG